MERMAAVSCHWAPSSIEMPLANFERSCHVVLRDRFCDHDRWADVWSLPGAYALYWIAVGAVVLLGIGILTGVKTARQKDPVG